MLRYGQNYQTVLQDDEENQHDFEIKMAIFLFKYIYIT